MSRIISTKPAVDFAFLKKVAGEDADEALRTLNTGLSGLTEEEAEIRLRKFGSNEVAREKPPAWYVRLAEAFSNPFSGLLVVLGITSYFTDVRLASPGKGDWTKVILLGAMITLSGLMKFWQEFRSTKAAEKLKALVTTTATVLREGETGGAAPTDAGPYAAAGSPINGRNHKREIPISELVPGDIVLLSAGDMIPADLRVLSSKDLS